MNKICHLNVIIKKKKVGLTQTLGFLSSVTLRSYLTNNDADGVYFSSSNRLIKKKNKVNVCLYPESIRKSKFILTHQRISTSGMEEKYAQPFKSDDNQFVLIHNGVINQFKGDMGSDTYGYFFNHFLKEFKEDKGSREKRIIRAINKTLKDCTGSYSIGIMDTKRDVLYYFKNSGKSITFHKSDDDDLLYITTSSVNDEYLDFFNRKFSEMEIKDKRIYRVTNGKNIIVKKVGKIKEEPEKRRKKHYTSNGGYDSNNGYWSDGKFITYGDNINKNSYKNAYGNKINKSNEKKVTNIFEKDKVEVKNEESLKKMFSEYSNDKSNENLEDVLNTELDSNFTLSDLGFVRNSINGEICGRCNECIADFRSEMDLPVCLSCLEKEGEIIRDEMDIADYYISGSVGYSGRF